MAFKIDKNVKMPDRMRNGFQSKYPFSRMKPGDSFLVNGTQQKTAHAAAWNYGNRQKPKQRFSIRKMSDGFRIWRVE